MEVYVLVSFVREEDVEFRGIEKGREVGAHSCDQEIILNMYAGNLPVESIAQLTKIPLGKVKGIIESIVQ